ncbi:hypothetical protein L218DRAFT_951594 [Marasmius fiardii PR-910]|nr:hypothetical protein L218DRAFT_951594 [Marasmius fiardii PR-910]
MITLYDLGQTKFPEHLGASPHVRKIIFTLNYKKLPFTLAPLHLESIESTAKSLGAPPTGTYADGSPKYTVPIMHDAKTDKAISDSELIAEYLDTAYPETPTVIPDDTKVLQSVFVDTVVKKMMGIFMVLLPKFDEFNGDEIREARKKPKFNVYPPIVKLTAEQEKEGWEKVKKELEALDGVYAKDQVFVMGDKLVYADFCVAAFAAMILIFYGEESEEYGEMKSWIGGRVGKVFEEVLKYGKV